MLRPSPARKRCFPVAAIHKIWSLSDQSGHQMAGNIARGRETCVCTPRQNSYQRKLPTPHNEFHRSFIVVQKHDIVTWAVWHGTASASSDEKIGWATKRPRRERRLFAFQTMKVIDASGTMVRLRRKTRTRRTRSEDMHPAAVLRTRPKTTAPLLGLSR